MRGQILIDQIRHYGLILVDSISLGIKATRRLLETF